SRRLGLTDCPGGRPRHGLWGRLTFPLFYRAAVLFILLSLTELEYLDTVPNASDALLWLEAKGRGNGRGTGRVPIPSVCGPNWKAIVVRASGFRGNQGTF
ncbi:MAG: hypothetical protein MUQ10_01455, partial [Anaerolineae bacterium]|nr:hypothetical protein [Anaerolineae bacterium]